MKKSANAIRGLIIPLTWFLSITSSVLYLLYSLFSKKLIILQRTDLTAEVFWAIFPSLLGTVCVIWAIIVGTIFISVLWNVLADWIDNLSVISNNSTELIRLLNDSKSGKEEINTEELKKKRMELIKRYRSDDITDNEKAVLYKEIMRIEKELKQQ